MNPVIVYILAAVVTAGALICVRQDLSSSLRSPYYGGKEANKLFRGRFGYIDAKRFVVVWLLVILGAGVGVPAVLQLTGSTGDGPDWWSNPWWFTIVLNGIITPMELVTALNNRRQQSNTRNEQQIPKLRAIRDGRVTVDLGYLSSYKNDDNTVTSFYRLFGWVRSSAWTEDERIWSIREQLRAIAAKPESEWFPE